VLEWHFFGWGGGALEVEAKAEVFIGRKMQYFRNGQRLKKGEGSVYELSQHSLRTGIKEKILMSLNHREN
jgi:hypothetical protein